jgi:hypothetical protein
MTILSSRSRRRLRSRSGGAHVGGLRRRPRLAHVEPVHGLGAGQRRQAEGGRDALLGLQADQAALPVPDAGSGEDRRVRASAEGHPGRPALPASTRITATSSSRSGRTRPDSAPGRSPRGRPTAPCADSGWPTSASSATTHSPAPGRSARARDPASTRGGGPCPRTSTRSVRSWRSGGLRGAGRRS